MKSFRSLILRPYDIRWNRSISWCLVRSMKQGISVLLLYPFQRDTQYPIRQGKTHLILKLKRWLQVIWALNIMNQAFRVLRRYMIQTLRALRWLLLFQVLHKILRHQVYFLHRHILIVQSLRYKHSLLVILWTLKHLRKSFINLSLQLLKPQPVFRLKLSQLLFLLFTLPQQLLIHLSHQLFTLHLLHPHPFLQLLQLHPHHPQLLTPLFIHFKRSHFMFSLT